MVSTRWLYAEVAALVALCLALAILLLTRGSTATPTVVPIRAVVPIQATATSAPGAAPQIVTVAPPAVPTLRGFGRD